MAGRAQVGSFAQLLAVALGGNVLVVVSAVVWQTLDSGLLAISMGVPAGVAVAWLTPHVARKTGGDADPAAAERRGSWEPDSNPE